MATWPVCARNTSRNRTRSLLLSKTRRTDRMLNLTLCVCTECTMFLEYNMFPVCSTGTGPLSHDDALEWNACVFGCGYWGGSDCHQPADSNVLWSMCLAIVSYCHLTEELHRTFYPCTWYNGGGSQIWE